MLQSKQVAITLLVMAITFYKITLLKCQKNKLLWVKTATLVRYNQNRSK